MLILAELVHINEWWYRRVWSKWSCLIQLAGKPGPKPGDKPAAILPVLIGTAAGRPKANPLSARIKVWDIGGQF
jgi:hypothetical protein